MRQLFHIHALEMPEMLTTLFGYTWYCFFLKSWNYYGVIYRLL